MYTEKESDFALASIFAVLSDTKSFPSKVAFFFIFLLWNRFFTAYGTISTISTSTIKGTVSQTAHAQVINQKWSDVFKFVICETKWRQQAEDRILTVTEAVETTLAVRRFLIRAAA